MKGYLGELVRRGREAVSNDDPAPGRHGVDRPLQLLLGLQYRTLTQQTPSDGARLSFDDVGFDVYSSTGEDGILLYIFALLGWSNRRAVDIGAAGIEGSNLANLLLHHHADALLIDGDAEALQRATDFYRDQLETTLFPPQTLAARITAENVNTLIAEAGFKGPIDLLCLDIDGVDYWIWKALDVVTPRVVVVEYQDILGPERSWTVPYDPNFCVSDHEVNRERYNYCGASLNAFTKLAHSKGYRLVGCARGGWNAFFVRNGDGDGMLPEVTVESCFRYRWNQRGAQERFPLVANMKWQEV